MNFRTPHLQVLGILSKCRYLLVVKNKSMTTGHPEINLELNKEFYACWLGFKMLESPMQAPGQKKTSMVQLSTGYFVLKY